VFGASALAVRLGLGRLPAGTTWRHLFGLALVAGVGFTVALFVTSISLTDPALAASAKLGILVGSVAAGGLGYAFLRTIPVVAEVSSAPAPDAARDLAAAPV
jgi:NhaA family Na+:H+ antiporter